MYPFTVERWTTTPAILCFFLVFVFWALSTNGQILPPNIPDTSAAALLRPQDSVRDSLSKAFRSYVVIVDTIKTYPFSSDTLHSLRIKEIIPKRLMQIPGYRRRGVFNPLMHYRWHSYWKRSLEGTFSFNEAAFSANWKSGGVNSVALGLNFDAKADYYKDKISFTNEFQSQFGGIDSRGQGIRKSLDKIFLDTKLGYKLKQSVFLFSSANFQSQYINGYRYSTDTSGNTVKTKISTLLGPGYLTESLGLEYKPSVFYSLRVGAISLRQVFVLDRQISIGTPSNYGVPIGRKGLTELGVQLTQDFHQEIMQNVEFKSHLEFFQSYKKPSNTNLRFDAYFTAKINRLINMNLSGTILYDNNQDPKPQFNQFLSLGLTYRYSEF